MKNVVTALTLLISVCSLATHAEAQPELVGPQQPKPEMGKALEQLDKIKLYCDSLRKEEKAKANKDIVSQVSQGDLAMKNWCDVLYPKAAQTEFSESERLRMITTKRITFNGSVDHTNNALRTVNNGTFQPNFQEINTYIVSGKYQITPAALYGAATGKTYYALNGEGKPIKDIPSIAWENLNLYFEGGYTNTGTNAFGAPGVSTGITIKTEDKYYYKVGLALTFCLDDIYSGTNSGKACDSK